MENHLINLSSHCPLKNQNITNAVYLVIKYLPSTNCVAGATLGPLVKQTHAHNSGGQEVRRGTKKTKQGDVPSCLREGSVGRGLAISHNIKLLLKTNKQTNYTCSTT